LNWGEFTKVFVSPLTSDVVVNEASPMMMTKLVFVTSKLQMGEKYTANRVYVKWRQVPLARNKKTSFPYLEF